ncbi:hypothetical protein PVA05_25830, partial [Escherichia coli]
LISSVLPAPRFIKFAHQLSIARSTVYKILEDERAS